MSLPTTPQHWKHPFPSPQLLPFFFLSLNSFLVFTLSLLPCQTSLLCQDFSSFFSCGGPCYYFATWFCKGWKNWLLESSRNLKLRCYCCEIRSYGQLVHYFFSQRSSHSDCTLICNRPAGAKGTPEDAEPQISHWNITAHFNTDPAIFQMIHLKILSNYHSI